ncbi:hypothetical protein MTO96_023111 [Rhipicephalus appendiculatus]
MILMVITVFIFVLIQLRRIDTPWVANIFMGQHRLPASADRPRATNFTHLCLSSPDFALGLEPPGELGGVDVAKAAKKFPSVAYLRVGVGSMKALDEVAGFGNLRSLTVTLGPGFVPARREFSLNTAACQSARPRRTGPRKLRWPTAVRNGETLPQAQEAQAGKLHGHQGRHPGGPRCVRLSGLRPNGRPCSSRPFFTHSCESLGTLFAIARFCDDGRCSEFLQYCAHYGQQFPFVNLERLTLMTDKPLRALKLEPRDLHRVTKSMPELRHLETDSYDLRLFFENCVTRGKGVAVVGRMRLLRHQRSERSDDRSHGGVDARHVGSA